MADNLLTQLANLRKLYSEAAPEDPKTISDYAWTIVKVLLQHTTEIDSITARQLLAECIKLPITRPSKLYSALLAAAIKVANLYPEFHFAVFLKMWEPDNLRPEDSERQSRQDGKSFSSLKEQTAKLLAHSLLLHPEDRAKDWAESLLKELNGEVFSFHAMIVSRIKEAVGKDGRKYRFVTLTSPEGLEVETISHNLQVSPLQPQPQNKHHYVNIGQLYNVLLRNNADSSKPAFVHAYLYNINTTIYFPKEIGYIESVDPNSQLMHIYDRFSRHFVAHILRFSNEQTGDFVYFHPIVPLRSKFKTAIIIGKAPCPLPQRQEDNPKPPSLIRAIRISNINKEKGYATWELLDKSYPITEQLSPLQISLGEQSPSFTYGHIALDKYNEIPPAKTFVNDIPLTIGLELYAVIYLKRDKDKQKRPYIAKFFPKTH